MKLKKLKTANAQVKPSQSVALVNSYFGNSGNKFGATTEDDFKNKLNSMSANELYEYALNFGLRVTDPTDKTERQRAIGSLMTEFRQYMSFFKAGDAKEVKSEEILKNEKIRRLMA